MSEIKYLQCPFCGWLPSCQMIEFENRWFYKVHCLRCHASLPAQDTVEQAYELWNNRMEEAE